MLVLLRVTVWIFMVPWIGTRVESHRNATINKTDIHFPYVVSIQIITAEQGIVNIEFYASGALVSERQALSICHKFLETDTYWQTPGSLLVVAGSSKLAGNHTNESETAQMRHVDRVIRHPKCFSKIPNIYGFDAAVLYLKKPMKLNVNVQPIAMKFKDLRSMEKELDKMEKTRVVCSTFRWAWVVKESPMIFIRVHQSSKKTRSKRAENNTATTKSLTSGELVTSKEEIITIFPVENHMVKIEVLAEIDVEKVLIANNAECKAAFCRAHQTSCNHDLASNGQFCTIPWEMANNTCLDSGGPLVCDGYLFGILDYEHCFLSRSPSIYAGPRTILDLMKPEPTEPPRTITPASTSTTPFLSGVCLMTITLTSSWRYNGDL